MKRKREQARRLFEEEVEMTKVAKRLGVPLSTVQKWHEEFSRCPRCDTKMPVANGLVCGLCVLDEEELRDLRAAREAA